MVKLNEFQWKAEAGSEASKIVTDFFEKRKKAVARASELAEKLGFQDVGSLNGSFVLQNPSGKTSLKSYRKMRGYYQLKKNCKPCEDYVEFSYLGIEGSEDLCKLLFGDSTFIWFGDRILKGVGSTNVEGTVIINLHPYQYFELERSGKLKMASGLKSLFADEIFELSKASYLKDYPAKEVQA